jgi:hypothetical protein
MNIINSEDPQGTSSRQDYFRENNLSTEYNILISKYLNYYIDILEISSEGKENRLNSKDEFLDKFSKLINPPVSDGNPSNSSFSFAYDVSKLLEDKKLEDLELRNEKQNKIGKFGWCINCRNQSNFYSERINFPICSNECELEIFRLNKLIDIDITVDSSNYRDDYINTLKILSKLSINHQPLTFRVTLCLEKILREKKYLHESVFHRAVELVNLLKLFF